MLHKPVEKIVYDNDGKAAGVISVGEDGKPAYAKCKFIVGDPTYFPEKTIKTSKVRIDTIDYACSCITRSVPALKFHTSAQTKKDVSAHQARSQTSRLSV